MQTFDKTNSIDIFGDKKRFREFFFSKGVAIWQELRNFAN